MKMLDKIVKEDQKYVSCIKLNGVPILPPVVTSAKRKELLKYKHQAVKLEKRLKRERELREYITRYYLPKLDNVNLLTESLEHKLAFLDEGNLTPTPSIPCVDTECHKKQLKLSCDLQVSQYTNNEFKVITNFENNTSQIKNIIENDVEKLSENDFDNVSNNVEKHEILNDFNEKIDDDDIGKPKLIRSDSYVLETPSPMLLEHLKRHCDQKCSESIPSNLSNVPRKEIITSTPNEDIQDKLNLTKSDFCSETESELKNISDHSINSTQDNVTVLSKDIDDDIVDADKENKKDIENGKEYDTKCSEKIDFCLDLSAIKGLSLDQTDQEKLTNILNAIPESFSKQILELLEKQKLEQTVRLNTYTKIQETHLPIEDSTIISNKPALNYIPQTEHSIYYTPEVFDSSQIHNLSSNVQIMNDNNKSNRNISLPLNVVKVERKEVVYTSSVIEASKTPRNCSRKLFNDSKRGNYLGMDWAASIIQAHVKGYLTRRLLRSERVQGLIQTIKDALICAMELHSECTDNINESDVELHRRLIQQVSAAVDAFHNVFFKTTTSEQMAIIRIDRERLKEKLKRPRSKGSISSRSSRSSRQS